MFFLSFLLLLQFANGQLVGRVNLTSFGPEVSSVAWGHLTLEKLETADNVVNYLNVCADIGVTLLDTADVYPPLAEHGFNMQLLGDAFQLSPGLRDKFEIVAKVGIVSIVPFRVNTTRAYLIEAIDRYFAALHVDFIDILLIHQPDPDLNAPEMAQLFEEYVDSGMIGYFGVSNWEPDVFDYLQSLYKYPLVTNEVEYSVLTPAEGEDGRVLNHLASLGKRALLWGPLGGDPVGRENRLFIPPHTPHVRSILNILADVASEIGFGVTEDQVALGWTLFHPSASVPLVGTMNPDRLRSQIDGAFIVKNNMTQDQWNRIHEVSAGSSSLLNQ